MYIHSLLCCLTNSCPIIIHSVPLVLRHMFIFFYEGAIYFMFMTIVVVVVVVMMMMVIMLSGI